jgi:hypothetical protein
MKRWSHATLCGVLVLACWLVGACGTELGTRATYPAAYRAPDGTPITLEQIEDIVQENLFTDEEKREALRDLGFEDEDFIDLLLTL